MKILRALLDVAKEFVQNSKELIDMLEMAAEKVGNVTEAGLQAMKDIAKYTRDNILNVHHVCFDTELEKASGACFKFSINVTVGGSKNFNMNTEACLDMSFAKKIGIAVAQQLYPGIDQIKENVMKAKGKKCSYNDET